MLSLQGKAGLDKKGKKGRMVSKDCNHFKTLKRTDVKNKKVGHCSGLVQGDVSGQETLVHELLDFKKTRLL